MRNLIYLLANALMVCEKKEGNNIKNPLASSISNKRFELDTVNVVILNNSIVV